MRCVYLNKSHRLITVLQEIDHKKSACCYELHTIKDFFILFVKLQVESDLFQQSRKIEPLIEPIEHTKTLNLVTACTQEARRGIDFIKLKQMSMIRERDHTRLFSFTNRVKFESGTLLLNLITNRVCTVPPESDQDNIRGIVPVHSTLPLCNVILNTFKILVVFSL